MTTNNIYVLVTDKQNTNSLPLAERFFDTLDEAKAWRPYDDTALYTIVRDAENGDQECSTDGGETWF